MAVPTKGNNATSGDYNLNSNTLLGSVTSYAGDDGPTRKGHPLQLFVLDVSPDYMCNICSRVLCKPMVFDCGCRFCTLCITEFLETQNGTAKLRCPACEELDPGEPRIDSFARRHLQKQKVFCENKEHGCEHITTLAWLWDHLQTCEYQTIPCENGCGAELLKSKAIQHLEKECPFRRVECRYCQNVFRQDDLEAHSATCRDSLAPCPNNCGASPGIPPQQLEQHLEECPEEIVNCYFEPLGCDFRGLRKDLDKHLRTNMQKHFSNIGRDLSQLKSTVAETQGTIESLRGGAAASSSAGDVEETVDKLSERMKKIQLTLVQKFDKIGKLEKNSEQAAKKADLQREVSRIDTLANQNNVLSNRVQKLEEKYGSGPRGRKGGASQQSLEQRVSTLENQISLHAMRLAEHDVRFQVHGTTSYNGSLVWKIKDYARRKRDADSGKTLSLYSQPFFSSRYGFKMCARVYLNGDGIGKDSHMSLFFVIMKGDYDSLLSWPFKQKVTLMLLDQENTRRHLSDSFRPDPTSSSFQKPTAEMNIASGCPLFVSQEVFRNSTSYLKDDTIYLKIVVDTLDLTPI